MSLWDEKNLTAWAHAWLEKAFETGTFKLPFPGEQDTTCDLSFLGVPSISGDISMHQTKTSGKPRPNFELKIDLDWKCEVIVDRGKSMLDLKGEMRIVDFNSEDYEDEDLQIRVIADTNIPAGADEVNWKNLSKKLETAVKKDGVKRVTNLLCKTFVSELIRKASGEPPLSSEIGG